MTIAALMRFGGSDGHDLVLPQPSAERQHNLAGGLAGPDRADAELMAR